MSSKDPLIPHNVKTLKSLKKWLSNPDPKNTIDIVIHHREAILSALSHSIDVCEIVLANGGIKNVIDGFQASQKTDLFSGQNLTGESA
jgi:hypothetical protein